MTTEIIRRYRSYRTERLLSGTFKRRYAFVGMGQHSLANLYPAINYLQVPLKYICVASERKAALVSRQFPGIRAKTDLDEILQDDEIGGVFVAASPSAHFGLASRVLGCGKSLFIEKPPCASLEELDSLVRLQESSGSPYVEVGLQSRYAPAVRILSRRLGKGGVSSYILNYRVGPYPEGDALLDLYIHPLDLVTALFGKAEIVACRKVSERTVVLILGHKDVCGTLELSTDYSWTGAEETLTVCARDGIYRLSQMDELTFTRKQTSVLGVPLEKVRPEPVAVEYLYRRNNMVPIPADNQVYSLGFLDEVRAFVDAVEDRGSGILTDLQSVRDTYLLLDRIRACIY